MRLFAAIAAEGAVREALVQAQAELRRLGRGSFPRAGDAAPDPGLFGGGSGRRSGPGGGGNPAGNGAAGPDGRRRGPLWGYLVGRCSAESGAGSAGAGSPGGTAAAGHSRGGPALGAPYHSGPHYRPKSGLPELSLPPGSMEVRQMVLLESLQQDGRAVYALRYAAEL